MLLMMMVFVGLVTTATRYRDLPVGRALHETLIKRPAVWLTTARLRRVVIMLILISAVALVWVEIAPVLAAFEFSPLLWFADVALYLDVMMLAAIAFAAVQARTVGKFLLAKLRGRTTRPGRRPRARSSSRRRAKRPPPANDDVPTWAPPLAA